MRTKEGARIFGGPVGQPDGWLRRFIGVTDGEAVAALDRCKELLVAVTHWVPPRSEQPIRMETWRAHVPRWFQDRCASPLSQSEAEEELRVWRSLDAAGKVRFEERQAWTLEHWLTWFDWSSDLRRSWLWWDGGTLDPDRFWIEVEISEEPAALGTLVWMMRAAGAETVSEEPAGSG